MSFIKNIDILKLDINFDYFTRLINAKLSGAIVSVEPTKDFMQQLSYLLSVIYCFECPFCERLIQIETLNSKYNCDCGLEINLKEVEFEERYVLNDGFYRELKEFFQQEFEIEYNKFKIIFGEKIKKELIHDGYIYVHITPKNLWTHDVLLIDEKFVDNFALGWDYFLDLFNEKKRIGILSNLEVIRESYLSETLYEKDNKNLFYQDNTINFIHISDFHIEGDNSDNEKILIVKSLINDLKKKILKENIVDFALITGDITQSAKIEQFKKASKIIIEKLENSNKGLNIDREKIFVVPGNHDINREFFNNDIFEKLKKCDEEKFKSFWYNKNEDSELFLNFKKLENFQLFQEEILKQDPIKPDQLFIFRNFEKFDYKIGILGLNTVWNGGKEGDERNLLMSKFQLIDALSKYFENGDFNLKIVFFHHPIESLNEEEYDEIKARICNNFDLVLFGHRHDTNYIKLEDYNTDTHLIRAGPIYNKEKKIRGSYNLVQIDIKNRIVRVIFRKPHKNNPEIYVYDNEASPYEKDLEYNGVFKFST
ncbi:MAG: metallophosphoesterase family protein [Promethearchaeota archaeon]